MASLEDEVGYLAGEELNFLENTTDPPLPNPVAIPAIVPVSKNRSLCSICNSSTQHLRNHVLGCHLPWFLDPFRACWICEIPMPKPTKHIQRNRTTHTGIQAFSPFYYDRWCLAIQTFFLDIQVYLDLTSLADLLPYLLQHQLYQPLYVSSQPPFTADEITLLHKGSTFLNLPDVTCFTVSPPNHLLSILHWRNIMILVSHLPVHAQTSLRHCQPPTPPTFPSYVDSHFHLDILLKKTSTHSYNQLEQRVSQGGTQISHAISNYVFPSSWPLIDAQVADDSSVYCTIGVHPHLVGSDWEARLAQMKQILGCRSFVGIGEVGLDFTSTCKCTPVCMSPRKCQEMKFSSQRRFLREVLPLAEQYNLPVVLHCRDNGDGTAASETLDTFIQLNLTHLSVHRHCFVGDIPELQRWLSVLPNVHFGFTNTILSDPTTSEALSHLSMDRVLLETDSPYLPPLRRKINTPWLIESVARRISAIKGLPLDHVRLTCNANAVRLYRLCP
ncbi:MAG: TatD family hydrolase [Sedimenticola sp.]